MSQVTNIILIFSLAENEKEIEGKLNLFRYNSSFSMISIDTPDLPRGWYGGNKLFESNIYLGVYNYFNLEEFVSHLNNIEWEERENVQLIYKEENDEVFKLITLTTGIKENTAGPPPAED
jgi:hypothetical protein